MLYMCISVKKLSYLFYLNFLRWCSSGAIFFYYSFLCLLSLLTLIFIVSMLWNFRITIYNCNSMKILEYNFTGKGHFLNKYWVLSGFIISEKGMPGRWKGGLMKRVVCPKIWTWWMRRWRTGGLQPGCCQDWSRCWSILFLEVTSGMSYSGGFWNGVTW